MAEVESETERLESRIERKESELQAFKQEPRAQLDARLSELADGIEATNPRDPTTPDNRSMHEHLSKLKEGIDRDPDAWVSWRKQKLKSEIETLENKIEDIE